MTRCIRCGVPSPNDPDAASNGGISQTHLEGESYCMVCVDYIREHPEEREDLPPEALKRIVWGVQ